MSEVLRRLGEILPSPIVWSFCLPLEPGREAQRMQRTQNMPRMPGCDHEMPQPNHHLRRFQLNIVEDI